MIKNYMEILVDSLLREITGSYTICQCEDCLDDIKTIALNNLPPMYFLSSAAEEEKTAFILDRQRRISVLAKVIEAVEVVKQNNHNTKNNTFKDTL